MKTQRKLDKSWKDVIRYRRTNRLRRLIRDRKEVVNPNFALQGTGIDLMNYFEKKRA